MAVPSPRPSNSDADHARTLAVRVPPELLRDLKILALRRGCNMRDLIIQLARQELQRAAARS